MGRGDPREDGDALAPVDDDETVSAERRVGTTVAGKYKLVRVLGSGGMGDVFEADDRGVRRVAVKLMQSRAARKPDAAARFLREAQVAARISHPNIVAVFDVGQDPADGALYMVQEYLNGTDLGTYLRDRGGRLPVRDTMEIVVPIMAALAAAHDLGVIHRDIKPDNVFIAETPLGRAPKLIDFGISKIADGRRGAMKLTSIGTTLGTPHYMSPEQARSASDIDARTDVWAIGVMLYELLAGRCPFLGDGFNELIVEILNATPPRLDQLAPWVPRPIADLVHHALERDPARRFGSMHEMLHALLACPPVAAEPWMQALAAVHRPAARAAQKASIPPPPIPGGAAPSPVSARPGAAPDRRVVAVALGFLAAAIVVAVVAGVVARHL